MLIYRLGRFFWYFNCKKTLEKGVFFCFGLSFFFYSKFCFFFFSEKKKETKKFSAPCVSAHPNTFRLAKEPNATLGSFTLASKFWVPSYDPMGTPTLQQAATSGDNFFLDCGSNPQWQAFLQYIATCCRVGVFESMASSQPHRYVQLGGVQRSAATAPVG
jgi:hypothetical protein